MVVYARPEVLVERTPARIRGRLRAAWPRVEALLCFLAVIGLALTLVHDYENVKTLSPVATDYKTVYASSVLFAKGGNPYDMGQIVGIYRGDGVVLPENMFGHMPVYPPITLLVLWPLAKLSMAESAVAWLVLSVGIAGAALRIVLREAREQGLGWGYRLALLAFAVSAPVLGFALDIGNVSPAASALAIIALMVAIRESQRFADEINWQALAGGGLCLGLALCLKPHLAIWIAAAIALVCGRAGRRIAALGAGLFAGCGFAAMGVLLARGQARMVIGSFLEILRSERTTGSMSPGSHEVLNIGAQITALDSLLGWWLGPGTRELAAAVVLVAVIGVLVWAAWRTRWLGQDRCWQVLFTIAMFGTGMLASYHRAHDAVLLAPLAGLWISTALRRGAAGWRRRLYWGGSAGILGLLLAQWFAAPENLRKSVAAWTGIPGLQDFVELRQAAAMTAVLAVLVVYLALKLADVKKKTARIVRSVPGGQ